MRHLLLLVLVLAACKKSTTPTVDKTGGGEVVVTRLEEVTPALLAGLADGSVPANRLVDPGLGVYEMVVMPGADEESIPDTRERRCDGAADNAIADIAGEMQRAAERGKQDEDYEIRCGADDAGMLWCSASGASEWAPNYEVLFVPDPTRGVRVAGILVWESGMNPEGILEEFLAETEKTGALCSP